MTLPAGRHGSRLRNQFGCEESRPWRFAGERMRRWCHAMVITCILLTASASAQQSKSDEEILEWIEDVLLGSDYGDKTEGVRGWVKTPTLSVMRGAADEQRLLAQTIQHLNGTLRKTRIKKIAIIRPQTVSADILVYFVPLHEFPSVAKRHNFESPKENDGYVHLFWNGRYEITSAYVLLASDRLKETGRLLHTTLEELTQSLGCSADSPVFPDSIHYEGSKGHGSTVRLAERDQQLLSFQYNRLKPGATRDELRVAFLKYWPRNRNGKSRSEE